MYGGKWADKNIREFVEDLGPLIFILGFLPFSKVLPLRKK